MLQDIVTPLTLRNQGFYRYDKSIYGHQMLITTAYLKDFDNNIIDDANEKLLKEPSPIYNVEKY
jgi:hypothetical protein